VPQSSDAQLIAALVTRHRIGIVAASVVVVLAAAGGFYAIREGERARPDPSNAASISLENLTVSQLTTSGKAERATISPDGKYVAYIEREADQYSLWIRQPATGSTVQIVPPQPGVVIRATSITPDGAFVDFVRGYELWRIPFLGGVARRLLDRVDSGIGWSPDGLRMAFIRANWPTNESWLFVADSDGSREHTVAKRRGVDGVFNALSFPSAPNVHPAWSPGGGVLAVSGLFENGPSLLFVDPATGGEQKVPIEGMEQGMDWMDEGTLVFSLVPPSGPSQLWKASYPDGGISRLTNDVNSYSGVSLTSDRNELVTTRTERRVGISVGDAGAPNTNDVVPLAPNPFAALAWAGDRVLYTTAAGTIMSVVPNRGAPSLVVEAAAQPVATTDGRTIVFNRFTQTLPGIWKADADGRNVARLSAAGFHAAITRDNQYVLYGGPTLSMVPMTGGTPTVISESFAGFIDTSPNGTTILVTTGEEPKATVTLCELPACTSRRTLTPLPAPSNLLRARFVPDGRGVAYVDGATQANIWVQPLDGTPARQLTHFNDGRVIDDFAWSGDGKRLAVARATVTNDIILFKGLRSSSPRR
jgi:Tol biopolymer transport system component